MRRSSWLLVSRGNTPLNPLDLTAPVRRLAQVPESWFQVMTPLDRRPRKLYGISMDSKQRLALVGVVATCLGAAATIVTIFANGIMNSKMQRIVVSPPQVSPSARITEQSVLAPVSTSTIPPAEEPVERASPPATSMMSVSAQVPPSIGADQRGTYYSYDSLPTTIPDSMRLVSIKP
jgi:hypothetical protein